MIVIAIHLFRGIVHYGTYLQQNKVTW